MYWFALLLKYFVFLLFFSDCCFATLSKSDRKSSKNGRKSFKSESSAASFMHDNINLSVTYQDVIKEHKSFSVSKAIVRHFAQDVLGYVTPWNNHGYDIAKLFTSKFTTISPVWLQLKPKDSKGSISIEGLHDIDKNWLLTLKELNKKVKLVPRIIFEDWSYPILKKLFEQKAEEVSTELIKLAKENGFNGYVIEIWSLLGGQMKMELTTFLIQLSTLLRRQDLDLILVIPPPSYSVSQVGMFIKKDFDMLAPYVTAFSLMSYDFSSPQRPGPNSPLPWLMQCIENLIPEKSNPHRKKLLLGLNFYGNVYSKSSGKPIVGHEYISILEKHKPKFSFNNVSGEHVLSYKYQNVDYQVYYPTLYSIQLRIQLAKEMGIGIAIWEIGQGLDYFYDLL